MAATWRRGPSSGEVRPVRKALRSPEYVAEKKRGGRGAGGSGCAASGRRRESGGGDRATPYWPGSELFDGCLQISAVDDTADEVAGSRINGTVDHTPVADPQPWSAARQRFDIEVLRALAAAGKPLNGVPQSLGVLCGQLANLARRASAVPDRYGLR
jgi:hypothetical protein